MKNVYLLLTALGFIGPNVFVTKVSIETGNVLFWLDPLTTFEAMFANDIATAFAIDLLLVVMVFFAWSYYEAKRIGMKSPWLIWVLTLMLGLSGALPLFLYLREKKLGTSSSTNSV